MSGFVEAFNKTMGHEGLYSNDRTDTGGETYKGISRVYNPSWGGWDVVDEAKTHLSFPDCLSFNEDLNDKVMKFYKERYFDSYRGDEMPEGLAVEMFDTSVNMGVGRAVKFLQISLNVLNRNGSLYPDMVADGDYGRTTHACLQQYLKTDTIALLLKIMNVLQGNHYIEYMTKSPIQEKFARGWFNRVSIEK